MTRTARKACSLAMLLMAIAVMETLILTGTLRGWLGIVIASLGGLPIGYFWARGDRLDDSR